MLGPSEVDAQLSRIKGESSAINDTGDMHLTSEDDKLRH